MHWLYIFMLYIVTDSISPSLWTYNKTISISLMRSKSGLDLKKILITLSCWFSMFSPIFDKFIMQQDRQNIDTLSLNIKFNWSWQFSHFFLFLSLKQLFWFRDKWFIFYTQWNLSKQNPGYIEIYINRTLKKI